MPRRTHRIHRKSRNPRSDGRNDSTEPWRDSRCRWRDYPPGPMSQPPHGADKTNSRRAAGASTWDRCWYDRLFRERHNGIRPDIPASCVPRDRPHTHPLGFPGCHCRGDSLRNSSGSPDSGLQNSSMWHPRSETIHFPVNRLHCHHMLSGHLSGLPHLFSSSRPPRRQTRARSNDQVFDANHGVPMTSMPTPDRPRQYAAPLTLIPASRPCDPQLSCWALPLPA